MAAPLLNLVSVNKTPARAASLVGQLLKSLELDTVIVHVANTSTIETLRPVLDALVTPARILICSSQWSSEEQQEANAIAKSIFSEISIINIPPGLDVREGSAGILHFLENAIKQLDIEARTNLSP